MVMMGGGVCTAALKEHLEAGFRAYATEQAAYTFNDNLASTPDGN